MGFEILSFMFNWKGTLIGAAKLAGMTSKIVSPENEKSLGYLMELLNIQRDCVRVLVEDLKRDYLDNSEEPAEDDDTMGWLIEGMRGLEIPSWAKLKNLDDPDTLRAVYERYETQKGMMIGTLNWARRLYLEEARKAGLIPNEEAPSSSLTDTKDEG
jgi:hypothetical protein